ncbi:hypothetical protein [Flavisolibacter nicotianae]|uniref:hypothetical protein n=1 Tax=Flavisolibacter nicotianae TaxID=2364882 RepID=UPI0013C3FB0D|nr:hypothetical protein [Flavisolibacter nicotianae]
MGPTFRVVLDCFENWFNDRQCCRFCLQTAFDELRSSCSFTAAMICFSVMRVFALQRSSVSLFPEKTNPERADAKIRNEAFRGEEYSGRRKKGKDSSFHRTAFPLLRFLFSPIANKFVVKLLLYESPAPQDAPGRPACAFCPI